MKKTLVALAVLAASGASFAQVAITGGVAMGWAGGQDSSSNQTSGIGVDTATIDFAVSEDLGGGLKLTAHEGFDTFDRGGVSGGDTGMTIGTSSWTVALGSTKLADYLQGANTDVASLVNGLDGRVLSTQPFKDWAGVSFMVTPSITLSVTEYEAAAGLGLGAGSGGAAATTGSRNTQYQVAFKSGAFGADAAFKAYDSSTSSSSAYAGKSITRAGASYDFGVAKVGGGVAATSLINGGTDTGTSLSFSVPFGAVTFSGQYINRTVSGSVGGAATDYNQGGYGLELDYALSKSTKIQVGYDNWQQISAAQGATGATGYSGTNSNLTEIALSKSF